MLFWSTNINDLPDFVRCKINIHIQTIKQWPLIFLLKPVFGIRNTFLQFQRSARQIKNACFIGFKKILNVRLFLTLNLIKIDSYLAINIILYYWYSAW